MSSTLGILFGDSTGVQPRKLSQPVRLFFPKMSCLTHWHPLEHEYAQYLAVSTIPASPLPHEIIPPVLDEPLNSPSSSKDKPAPKSAIQIWRFGPSKTPVDKEDFGIASCVMILCLDGVSPARMLRWCPLPADDKDQVCPELNSVCIQN